MDQASGGTAAKALQRDLARKHQMHGARVEALWRSFPPHVRARAVRDGAADGAVLAHRDDASLGVVCKLLPELNLRDITEAGSDFLLDLLRDRATTPLLDQFAADRDHIEEMIRTRGLRHVDERRLRDSFAFFLDDEENYGRFLHITAAADREEVLADFAPAIQAGICVPQTTGDFILMRQTGLLQALNLLVEDILEIGSTTRAQAGAPAADAVAPVAAMARLSVQAPPPRPAVSDLLETARDRRAALQDYVTLLSTAPVVLAHAVNIAFFTRPELVADERGRVLPVHTDRFISPAFFEVVHEAVRAAAVWDGVCRLLERLQGAADKPRRATVLQELRNVCGLELGRTHAQLKRRVQVHLGARHFRRVSGVYDRGHARVSLKIKPEKLTRTDPQLHYLLRLCQAETGPGEAAEWLDKLGRLLDEHADERDRLSGSEFAALGDHAVLVAFLRDLTMAVSMPPPSRKAGQLIVSRCDALEAELAGRREEIDLADLVVPIDHLREPGVAERALDALSRIIVDRTGTTLGSLYQDAIEDGLAELDAPRLPAEGGLGASVATGPGPAFAEAPQGLAWRVEQRRQKEKTRPARPSAFACVPPTPDLPAPETDAARPPAWKVKASTAAVFRALFDRAELPGTVRWASFAAAMGDLGFGILPKYGSVFTFTPPENMGAKTALTLHRPHKATIEEWLLPVYARRLQRAYGWDKDTFVTE